MAAPRPRVVRALVSALAACALLTAGCGEDDSPGEDAQPIASTPAATAAATPEVEVRKVVADELAALAAGRGAEACELMTAPGEQQAIEEVNQAAREREVAYSFDDCAAAISASLGGEEPDPAVRDDAVQLADGAEIDVTEAGATAVLGELTLTLDRVDGEYRIDDPGPLVRAALGATG
jgi:hypothetical protein